MTYSADIESNLQQIVDAVVAEVNPLRVVLFGSVARGEQRPDSDIDLMVVVPEGSNRLHVAQDLYMLGIPRTEFVVTTPEVFERNRDSLSLVYRDIDRDGKTLYAA